MLRFVIMIVFTLHLNVQGHQNFNSFFCQSGISSLIQCPQADRGATGAPGKRGPAGAYGPKGSEGDTGECECKQTETLRSLISQLEQKLRNSRAGET